MWVLSVSQVGSCVLGAAGGFQPLTLAFFQA